MICCCTFPAKQTYEYLLPLDPTKKKQKRLTTCHVVGNTYYGVVGPCGGHTNDYHFHRSFSCLYSASGGHSTHLGEKKCGDSMFALTPS